MRVFLSLGSNLGDRAAQLHAAIEGLDKVERTRVAAVSRTLETEAWGDEDQPEFLNLAVEIETALEPLELLNALKDLEKKLGRRHGTRWGPREIDLDIILWGSKVLECPDLTLPHKEFRRRAFVLEPLAEIAADAVDPVSGSTVRELAMQLEAADRNEGIQSIER